MVVSLRCGGFGTEFQQVHWEHIAMAPKSLDVLAGVEAPQAVPWPKDCKQNSTRVTREYGANERVSASVESNKCFLEPRFTHGSCQEYHCPRHLDLLQSALPSETIVFKLVVNIISGSRNSG